MELSRLPEINCTNILNNTSLHAFPSSENLNRLGKMDNTSYTWHSSDASF